MYNVIKKGRGFEIRHTKNLLFLHFMYKIYREIDDRYYNLTDSNHCTHEKKKFHAIKI